MRKKLQFTSILQKELVMLYLIIVVAFVLRLYRIHYPLADWHSFRQVDTASVTREYVKNGVDILHPKYHDLSNIQSGSSANIGLYKTFLNGLEKYPVPHRIYHQFNGYRITVTSSIAKLFGVNNETSQKPETFRDPNAELPDNIDGWRMVEFPFINAGIASLLRIFPQLSLVLTSRIVSVLFSLGTLTFLYLLIRMISGKTIALITALVFSVMPYSIYYSRVVLPEPGMLFFSTFSLWAWYSWVKKSQLYYVILSIIGFALALLLKPFVLFLAPVYVALFLQKSKKKVQDFIVFLIFFILSLLPLYYWRKWIQAFPSGIPASDWLYNSNGILFRPSWFYWLGYQRLTKLLLGIIGIVFVPFAFFGVIEKLKSKNIFSRFIHSQEFVLASWWFGILMYFIIIATGNVQHDYYQVLMIPVVSWTVGLGVYNLYTLLNKLLHNKKSQLSQQVSVAIVLVICSLSWFMAWRQVDGYFNVNNWEFIEAGKAVDRLTPPTAKVIAPAFGDTTFLFQTNRRGWPIDGDIDAKIANGAQFYVTTSYDDEARELETKYDIVEKNDRYLILDLQRPLSSE